MTSQAKAVDLGKENIHPPFEARACDECHKVEKP